MSPKTDHMRPYEYPIARRWNILLIAVFCTFLLVTAAGYAHFIIFIQREVVAHPESAEQLLGRRCDHGFPRPTFRKFLTGAFQKQLEAACQDNIVGRDLILKRYRDVGRMINRRLLGLFPREESALLPMGGNVAAPRDLSRLLWLPAWYEPTKLPLLQARADYYNQLVQREPQVRVYVFADLGATAWWLQSNPYPGGVMRLLDDGKYASAFESMLTRGVTYSWIGRGLPAAEELTAYYQTDHHWTMAGSWMAYRYIHDAMLANTPVLGLAIARVPLQDIPGLEYQGTRAYRAVFAGMSDRVQDGAFGLPPLIVDVPSISSDKRSLHRQDYLNGSYSRIPFHNHYADYFGVDYPLIHYQNPASTNDRNLLVIGDSMDNALEPLLASHYRHAYFADPRQFDENLDTFIKQQAIHDVVFIGQQGWILGLSKPLE